MRFLLETPLSEEEIAPVRGVGRVLYFCGGSELWIDRQRLREFRFPNRADRISYAPLWLRTRADRKRLAPD